VFLVVVGLIMELATRMIRHLVGLAVLAAQPLPEMQI
jgi:hypothetical protein